MKIGTDGILLGAWCFLEEDPKKILDIGSGTGVVSLMLAQRSNALIIDSVEVEKNAFEQTVANFESSEWSDILFCYHSTFQNFGNQLEGENYDLIVSNPPFYTDSFETKNTARNKARFTSSLSFIELIKGVFKLLSKQGQFITIIPFKEEVNFIDLAEEKNMFINEICRVKGNNTSKVKRSLLTFSFYKKNIKTTTLVIEKARHQYTEDYINLTKDFYIKM